MCTANRHVNIKLGKTPHFSAHNLENGTMGVRILSGSGKCFLTHPMDSVTFKTLCYPPQTRINLDLKFKIHECPIFISLIMA